MIQQLLDSDLELVVQAGFIHVPLLFDPSVEREIRAPSRPDILTQVDGRQFVRAVSLQSLLDSYPAIHPDAYEELRTVCQQEYAGASSRCRLPVDANLETILFQVMPHFIRGQTRLGTRGWSAEELLDLIERKLHIPARCYEEASALQDGSWLRRVLGKLEERAGTIEPPKDGPIAAREVGEWIRRAMARRILDEEKARLKRLLEPRREAVRAEGRRLAVLLHIVEEGALEIDGFGFSRIGSGEDYVVYKRTGEYALKDYYGRTYLFPGCRVAVSNLRPLRPFVMENYRHPFLEGCDAGQDICLRELSPPSGFTAAAVITALEGGIGALLHGYSGRRRNGYHSLDRVTRRIGGSDFSASTDVEDPDHAAIRGRHVLDVDFEDYRVPREYPKIASGQVPVTNEYTP